MDNCIIDNLIGNIIWNCRCIPNIASSEAKERFSNMELKFCKGEGLNCANAEMDSIHDVKNVTGFRGHSITTLPDFWHFQPPTHLL